MSDAQSWYARRFARQAPQGERTNPPAGYQFPGQQVPMRQYPQAPQQIPQQQYREPTTVGNLWNQMQAWRGGKAHKIDNQPCPQCGSDKFYSRTGAEVRRGPPPAPHCFECGYNGMFEQGLVTTWQGS